MFTWLSIFWPILTVVTYLNLCSNWHSVLYGQTHGSVLHQCNSSVSWKQLKTIFFKCTFKALCACIISWIIIKEDADFSKKVKSLPGCPQTDTQSDAVWTCSKEGPVPNPVRGIGKDHIHVNQRRVVLKALLFWWDWYDLELSIFASTYAGVTGVCGWVEEKLWPCTLFCFLSLPHRALADVGSVISLRTNLPRLSHYSWQEPLHLPISKEYSSLEIFHISCATYTKQNIYLHWIICIYYQN